MATYVIGYHWYKAMDYVEIAAIEWTFINISYTDANNLMIIYTCC